MKKGNKVLALFLAAVMLTTSVTWDFGKVKAEETTETTSAIKTTDDGVSIDFDNIDVAELDEAGYVSTKFASGAPVKGEINQAVSKHWFSGDGDDTPYGSGEGSTIKAQNTGLKTQDVESDNSRTVMYTPYTYEDFQVSAEIYYGAFSGIVIGEKNVYPEDVTSSSVAIFFNSGRLHIMGAVERDTATIMRGTSAAIANNGSALGYKIFNNGSGDTIKANAGETYTVNVKKTGNHLIIWYSGGSGLITIELADSYKTGWIGIQSKCYDGDGGGFKSLNIEKVHAVEHHELDNAVMSELDDMGYSASMGSTVKLNSVGAAFFSGKTGYAYGSTTTTLTSANEGVKNRATGGSIAGLNIPYIYKNFRLEAEVYHGQVTGVSIGAQSGYASVGTTSKQTIALYFNESVMELCGAIGAKSAKTADASSASAPSETMYKLTPKAASGSAHVGVRDEVRTLVIEVKDGTFTMWMEGYSGYVSMPIGSDYATEKISFIQRYKSTDKGGFKSYTITNLDAGDAAEFDNVYLNNLTAAGYTASDCADSTLTDKAVSDVWFSGESGYSSTEKNKNDGLKPKDTTAKDGNIDLLNLPKVYENFRLKTTMYHGQVVGVAIGKNGVKPSASSGSDKGVITIYTNSKYLELTGSINKASVNLTAGSEVTNNSNLYHYVPVGFSANWNQERTLVVELQNNILSVWMEGYAGVLRVRVTDNYATENIALIARRPDTDGVNAGGGLKSYTIEKLPATDNINTTVDVAGYTDFDFVDTSVLDAKGFSVSKFNSDGTVIATDALVGAHMYAGEVGVSTAGKVAYNYNYTNRGLKARATQSEATRTILNTPYTATNGYEDFSASLEVYWGAGTGIVLGPKNVLPKEDNKSIMIYFNGDQIQLFGEIDPSSVVLKGGTGYWNVSYDPTFIFRPGTDFSPKSEKHEGEVYDLNVELKDGALSIWVEGYDTVLSMNTTTDFVHESVGIVHRQYEGDAGGLKNFTIESLEGDIVREYDATSFATLRSADGHTAPEYKNYLFAGWFTEPTCTAETAISSSTLTIEEGTTVYAKFVSRYVLSVKAQVAADLVDGQITNDDATGEIRFATTVDTEKYSQVGFNITYDKDRDGVYETKPISNNSVYMELKAFGTKVYQPTDFSKASKYFKACTVKNIGADYFDIAFSVTAFWKTMDGTVVEGDTAVKTINQGISVHYLKDKTALFVGDSIQDGANFNASRPEEGRKYKAWYDRMARYYGMDTEEVANKGWALTNKDTSGRSQIVTQLDSAKKASYDFIILEGGVNDVRIDQDTQNPDITIDWGTINEDPNATFTDDNIAGAMQDLIVKTQAKFPDAKIVYMINHHFGANATNMKNYVALVKAACRVHDIAYVDFSDTEAYPSLEPLTVQSTDYIPDNLHPTAAGYELTTPILADCMRKVLTGEYDTEVYVASTGVDQVGNGTKEAPYRTLNYAVSRVADGGTIYVQDTLACKNPIGSSFSLGGYGFEDGGNIESGAAGAENVIDKVNYKQVTIAGDNDAAVLDFSVAGHLFLNESVILKDIQVKWPSRINAEGNTFIVEESVTQVGDIEPMLIGGSHYNNLDKTDLRIYAGTYSKIIGGQLKYTVGETNVVVGGKVNENVDVSDHTFGYVLYGGCYSEGGTTKVSGDTHVTVEEGAKFRYVYGGGIKASGNVVPTIDGETHVTVTGGNVMSVFGGGYKIPCGDTNVKITGGTIEQVFGGSESASATGNTNIELLGGTITRRVYGGCYNDFSSSLSSFGWVTTDYHVAGTTNITIDENAQITFTSNGSDRGVFAGSRYKEAYADEKATVIFLGGCYEAQKNLLGRDSTDSNGKILGSPNIYDYLVNATTGGTVTSADGILTVTPNDGYTATVDGATITAEGANTYTLPETDGTITVTFSLTN